MSKGEIRESLLFVADVLAHGAMLLMVGAAFGLALWSVVQS